MKSLIKRIIVIVLMGLTILAHRTLTAQTTGKIVGRVTANDTGEPLPFANVMIDGTNRGTATDDHGDFYLINITPGVYTIKVLMIGYEPLIIQNVRISVNRTTNVEARLHSTVLAGEQIVVQAERIAIKKDQTSSIRNVSSDEIKILPIEDMQDVVALQPGVVRGHFRGGRSNEVAYLVDGMAVTETFSGSGSTVEMEPETIQDVEVITGTFNAEYGQAMSGVVNVVTKGGGNQFHGAFSGSLANYFTPNKDIFIGLTDGELNRNQDYKFQLGGPIWRDKITFFTNFRYQNNKNHLSGIRRFNVHDYSFFLEENPDLYYSEHTGDSSFVPMENAKNISVMGKLTSHILPSLRISMLYTYNNDFWRGYNHVYKYNPDGMPHTDRTTHMLSFSLNHQLSSKIFYELKLSVNDNTNGTYVFEDPLDPRYIHDAYFNSAGPGFYTGGQNKNHSLRKAKQLTGKFDLTWQIDKHHNVKTGFLYTRHDLDYSNVEIRNQYTNTEWEEMAIVNEITGELEYPYYVPVVFPDSSVYSDIYRVKPFEMSGYIQDKIEFDELVINLGLRYDYFNPETVYPSQPRNPGNQQQFEDPDKMSAYPSVKAKTQISPRLGLAYQLGKTALLHFSYGHFFQMPPMYALYQNHSFRIAPTDYQTTMGSALIKPQKTVQYEVGLWQELTETMGIEVALFYRDIYDLLSAKVISTFNQIEYGLYSNKDYGNAKGLEIKYDFRWDRISANLNYTLQYTRGNADNPTQTFTRAGQSRDPIARLIPMSWDQRHTLNATVTYVSDAASVTLTGYYNSGTPFTWSPLPESRLADVNLYPNNEWQPSQISVDLGAAYTIPMASGFQARFFLNIYNLFDRLNEDFVNSQTGRAYTGIIREKELMAHRSNFNTYEDVIQDPSAFTAPRLIKAGIGIVF